MAHDLGLTLSLPCSYASALRQLAWPAVRGYADSLDRGLQRLGLVDHPRVLASGRPGRGYKAASAVLFQPHPGAFAALLDGAALPRLLLAHDLDIHIVGYPPYAARGFGDDAVVGVLVFGARDYLLIEAIEASPGYIASGGAELWAAPADTCDTCGACSCALGTSSRNGSTMRIARHGSPP